MKILAALLLFPALLFSGSITAAPAPTQGMRAEQLDAFLDPVEDSSVDLPLPVEDQPSN